MRPPHFFTLPSPFDNEPGTVWLLEPPHARAGELRARLLDESYDKPFVIDDGERRYLYFNVRLMQSAMRLKAPNDLDLAYTQKMMSFLLFIPRPRRIALIGLGGGSLVKFCHTRLPGTHFTAVELDPHIIALRESFLLPEEGERLQIVEGDGADWLERTDKGLDALLVDAFDRTGLAPGLGDRAFFESARDKLAGNGVLVMNLAGAKESYAGAIGNAMDVFDEQVIVFPVPEDGNHILLAFRDPYSSPAGAGCTTMPRSCVLATASTFRPSWRSWSAPAASATPAARPCAADKRYSPASRRRRSSVISSTLAVSRW